MLSPLASFYLLAIVRISPCARGRLAIVRFAKLDVLFAILSLVVERTAVMAAFEGGCRWRSGSRRRLGSWTSLVIPTATLYSIDEVLDLCKELSRILVSDRTCKRFMLAAQELLTSLSVEIGEALIVLANDLILDIVDDAA